MLVRQGLTCLLLGITAVAVVFLAAQDSSRTAQARVIYNRVVDDAGTNCTESSAVPVYMTIDAALDAAVDNNAIFVCDGTYQEMTMNVTDNGVSLIGPGATPEDDGTALLTAGSASNADRS